MIEIYPPDAEVVRDNIYRPYAAGQSIKAIARALNRAGIPAPTSGRGARHGWGASTIAKMLRNERYVGIWTWNQTRWLKDPDTGRRRSIGRPSTEWIRQERPELRIIEEPLWRAVQERLRFVREAFGCAEPGHRPRGRAAVAYSPCLLSGLIVCGICGANLVGQSYGTGLTRRAMYRCGAAAAKGSAVCAHGTAYGRQRLEEALVARFRTAMTPRISSPSSPHGCRPA